MRIRVDGSRVINQWRDQTTRSFIATRRMTAGEHEVRVEWYERSAKAVARVNWRPIPPPTGGRSLSASVWSMLRRSLVSD
jgi:hypothetical protein